MNTDRRPPEALVSEDVRLPYSKGLMAKTLMGTGIRPERAYELARLIEGELVRGHEDETVGAERLYDVAASVLAAHEGEEAVRLLRRLQALRELDLPIVLLIGGATGTGKSTVATEIAHRLGITRVTSTDTVRQTMRAFFSQKFMPSIHYSSFEAGPAVRIHESDEADAALLGFKEQTRNVLVGVKAVIARALEESYSLAVEGVHLVPGALRARTTARSSSSACSRSRTRSRMRGTSGFGTPARRACVRWTSTCARCPRSATFRTTCSSGPRRRACP